MAYQEVTRTSYGKQLQGSLGGMLTGLLLIVAGTALLWWNEGRAVKTDKMLKEAESVTVEMPDISTLNSEYEGKLVYATGFATTQDSLIDQTFDIGVKAIALIREVEYYQWVESSSSESKDKLGGAKETTTTYDYHQEWISQPVNSQNFKDSAYRGRNFVLRQVENEHWWAENVTFGAFNLPTALIHQISSAKPFYPSFDAETLRRWNTETERAAGVTSSVENPQQLAQTQQPVVSEPVKTDSTATKDSTALAINTKTTETPVPAEGNVAQPEVNATDLPYVHVTGNELYFGKNPAQPQVGDTRIRFTQVSPTDVSIIASVSGNTFKPFKAKNGKTFETLSIGTVSAEEIYSGAHTGNKMFLWLLRILGFFFIYGGLKSVFGILETLLKVVPFLASIMGWGVRIVCGVIALVWSLIIVAFAWLFYRPVIGITLLVIAAVLVWLFAFKGKDKLKNLNASRASLFVLLFMFQASLFLPMSAQTIQKGNKFWDGQYLYVTEVSADGLYRLKGMDITGHQQNITLKKDGNKLGVYKLVESADGQPAPYGCMYGCRVQYIRQDGMNFLAFYPEEHTWGQVAVLTPDNIINCNNQQKFAEEETMPLDMVSDWLMNQKYISQLHPEIVQQMIDKLKLKPHPTIIERSNQQLLAYAQAMGLFGRNLEEEPTEGAPLEPDHSQEYTVRNEREFISCLGSNRTIHIEDGTVLNLSRVLDDKPFFNSPGRMNADDYYPERQGDCEIIVSCSRFDGNQLELVNVHNLTIRGGKNCQIVVEPRYANVFNFYQCTNISLDNLTIGHTEEGYCEGGVIFCENSEAIHIADCDLYGCGTYGLVANVTHGIVMERTIIRDCSYGIMELHGSQYCSFIDCDFIRCREFSLISVDIQCKNTRFSHCRFAQNQGPLFFLGGSAIMVESCEIHHPKDQQLGNVDSPAFCYMDNKTRWFRDSDPLPDRGIGPQRD